MSSIIDKDTSIVVNIVVQRKFVKIINTMSRKNNKDIIIEILTDFELEHEDQDFETLKAKMLHKLNSL